jgi:hypothetical protein
VPDYTTSTETEEASLRKMIGVIVGLAGTDVAPESLVGALTLRILAASIIEQFGAEIGEGKVFPIHRELVIEPSVPGSNFTKIDDITEFLKTVNSRIACGKFDSIWKVGLYIGGFPFAAIDSNREHNGHGQLKSLPTSFVVSTDESARFCSFIGDNNPIHTSREAAARAGLTAPTIPGTLLAALLITLAKSADPLLDRFALKFRSWVPTDQAFEISLQETDRWAIISNGNVAAILRGRRLTNTDTPTRS